MNPVQTLTEEALLLRLRGSEHDFVERKPLRQKGEWLQTAVAFANSAPIGWPAVLFVGVDDEGNPQQASKGLEDLQKSLVSTLRQAYPPIYFDLRPLHIDDKACLAVVIPGSTTRPHFAGESYVRDGPETRVASDSQFTELIASHNSKVRLLLEWSGKAVTLIRKNRAAIPPYRYSDDSEPNQVEVKTCNAQFVTFSYTRFPGLFSEPLSKIELSFDHNENPSRLLVLIYTDR